MYPSTDEYYEEIDKEWLLSFHTSLRGQKMPKLLHLRPWQSFSENWAVKETIELTPGQTFAEKMRIP